MDATKEDSSVLVIGAGSTGLLIAQGLKRSGIPAIVFEKSDEFTYKDRPRHWSMALHWGVSFLSKCLPEDILAELRDIESDPRMELTHQQEKFFPFVNGKTGEVIAQISGESTRRASRAKLRKLLSRGIDVRYGKRVIGIEHTGARVTVTFQDGDTAEGAMLVGCDGAKSAVRAHLLNDPEHRELAPVPLTNAHIAVSFTREQALFIRNAYHPSVVMSPHPDQSTSALITMADVEEHDKPETWVFLMNYAIYGTHEQPKTNVERLKLVKSYAANYCEPFRSAAEWLPEDTWVPPDVFSYWRNPRKWNNHGGRITIAGDAAHPVAPFRGQGLNLALEDAFRFVEALEAYVKGIKTLDQAIDEYDAEVLERGKNETELSNIQTYGTHHWDVLMQSPMMTKTGMNKA